MDTTAELNSEESLSSAAAMAADNASPESTGAEVGQAPAPSVSEPDASHEPEATAKGGEAVPAEPASPKLELISFFPASERAPRVEAAPAKAPRNFVAPGLVAPRSALSPRRRRGLRANASIGSLGLEGPGKRALGLDRFKPDGTSGCDRGRARPRGDRRRAKGSRRDETGGLGDARRQRRSFAAHRPGRSRRARPGRPLGQARRTHRPRLVVALCGSRSSSRQIGKEGRLADCRRGRPGPRRVVALCGSRGSARQIGKEGRLADCRRGRSDHDASPRFADLAARLDKLEKKAASPTVAAVAPAPPPKPIPIPAKVDPVVSNETTASIEKPKPPLRGYAVIGVGDGFAMIGGREGEISVGAGDTIPGLGRVLRIERHGREWLVVTSVGVISGEGGPY